MHLILILHWYYFNKQCTALVTDLHCEVLVSCSDKGMGEPYRTECRSFSVIMVLLAVCIHVNINDILDIENCFYFIPCTNQLDQIFSKYQVNSKTPYSIKAV